MKKVRGKTYIHKSEYSSLIPEFRTKIDLAISKLPPDFKWNIVRVDASNKISFLYYSKFKKDPHPSLMYSMIVDLDSRKIKFHNVSRHNPPILHRKETFLKSNDENYEKFAKLTQQEIKAGLLDPTISHKIGFKKYWEDLLSKKKLTIINHQLKLNI